MIQSGSGLTRAEIQRLTGLSRGTVNGVVAALLEGGWIVEGAPEQKGPGSGSGRPAVQLEAVAGHETVAGVDVGHRHVRVAIGDFLGRVLAEDEIDRDVDADPAGALALAARMTSDLATRHGLRAPARVVLGLPYPLVGPEPSAPPAWSGLESVAGLGEHLRAPVQVENDALAGAVGELHHGAGRGRSTFLYVKASHGLGSALVVDGRPHRGASGHAGEIGHTGLPGGTRTCRCGRHGCLETAVNLEEVRRRVAHAHPHVRPEQLDLARPDALTRGVLRTMGRRLGESLAPLCDLLNPDAVIVGGALGGLVDGSFRGGVADGIAAHAQPGTWAAMEVVAAELGPRAEILGAVTLAAGVPEG